MSKFIPSSSFEISPITTKKELVMSRLGSSTQEQNGKLVVIDGAWQIDEQDVLQLLKWLDTQAPLFNATRSLEKAAADMRVALRDIWGAVKDTEGSTSHKTPSTTPILTGTTDPETKGDV